MIAAKNAYTEQECWHRFRPIAGKIDEDSGMFAPIAYFKRLTGLSLFRILVYRFTRTRALGFPSNTSFSVQSQRYPAGLAFLFVAKLPTFSERSCDFTARFDRRDKTSRLRGATRVYGVGRAEKWEGRGEQKIVRGENGVDDLQRVKVARISLPGELSTRVTSSPNRTCRVSPLTPATNTLARLA